MSQLTTEFVPTNNVNSRVRFSDQQKVHINILLESKSYNVIGFVIINEHKQQLLTLSNVRKSIASQFDDDQLEILGGTDAFKFLQHSIPISKRQESLISVIEINITNPNEIKTIQRASFTKTGI